MELGGGDDAQAAEILALALVLNLIRQVKRPIDDEIRRERSIFAERYCPAGEKLLAGMVVVRQTMVAYVFGTTWRTLRESLGNRRATQPLAFTLALGIFEDERGQWIEQLGEAKLLQL